ncbi:phage major capsid protein [Niameybacter massiliensis]|uniref:Phage major capsid protein n=1 Tax=Holtiella tumoricola TaxID=3018743 RepID=A0AA42J0L7_9FIRM|nr:phage major capsid protein [Holtiella tumoricola]MDA3731567.1 phage major capsid protein [Holtiella tumoricola]
MRKKKKRHSSKLGNNFEKNVRGNIVDYSEFSRAFKNIPQSITKSDTGQNQQEEMQKSDFQLLEVKKSEDGTKGILVGYANKYNNVDLHGDIITKGAFAEDVGKTFPYLFQHDKWSIDSVIGQVKILEEDDIGCKCEITLFLDKEDGKPIFPHANKIYLLAQKGLLKNSIGAFILQREYKEESGRTIRVITKAKLREVSGTLFPANPESIITTVKGEESKGEKGMKLEEMAKAMGITVEELKKSLGTVAEPQVEPKQEPETTKSSEEDGMKEFMQKAFVMAVQNILSGNVATNAPTTTKDDEGAEPETISKAEIEKMINGVVEKAGLSLGGDKDVPDYVSKNEEALKAFAETSNGFVKLSGAAFAETNKAFMDPGGATQGQLLSVENRSFLAYVQPKLTMWDVCQVSNDDSMSAEFIIDLWDGDVSEELKPGQVDNEMDSNFGIKKVMANRIATHVDVPVNMLRNKNIIELASYLQTKIGAKLKLKANNKFAIGTGDGIDGIQGIFKADDVPKVEFETDLPTLKDINKMVAAIPSRYDDHPMVAIMSKAMLYHLYDLELDNSKPLIRSLGNDKGQVSSLFGKYPIILEDNAENEIIFGDLERGYGIHLQIDVELDRDDKILFTKGLTRLQGRIFVGGRVVDQHALIKLAKKSM